MKDNYMKKLSIVATKVSDDLIKVYEQKIRMRFNVSIQSKKIRIHIILTISLWSFDNSRYHYKKNIESVHHAKNSLYDFIEENNYNFLFEKNFRNDFFEEYNNNDFFEENCRNVSLKEKFLNNSFVKNNRKHFFLWNCCDRSLEEDISYDVIEVNISQFHQQENEISHHLKDNVYESKISTTSKFCFRNVFSKNLDWRTETISSENNEANNRNRQRQLQNSWTDKLNWSVSFNFNNETHFNVSRVSRATFKNKTHWIVKSYARTIEFDVARYKDYSELFEEFKNTILIFDDSNFDIKMIKSLKFDDDLNIFVINNATSQRRKNVIENNNSIFDEIRDIIENSNSTFDETKNSIKINNFIFDYVEYVNDSIFDDIENIVEFINSTFDHTKDIIAASNSAFKYAEHENVVNNFVFDDIRNIVEFSDSTFDHIKNDIYAVNNVSFDNTLLRNDYQISNFVSAKSNQKQCRQRDQQVVANDWIDDVHENRALFTNFNEFDYNIELLYEL